MSTATLPVSVRDLRGQAIEQIVNRLARIDLSPLLVYRLDSTPESALPFLAWQFDMLAPQWQLAAPSGISLRNLLKLAIPLHQTLGTPYAIKTALAALGFTSVTIQEGQDSWGGSSWPSDQGWAVFRVLIPFGSGIVLTEAILAQMIAAILFFKPLRSWLDSVRFSLPPSNDMLMPAPFDFDGYVDVLMPAPSDSYQVEIAPLVDVKTIAPLYDGHFYHHGITRPGEPTTGFVDSGTTINTTEIDDEDI